MNICSHVITCHIQNVTFWWRSREIAKMLRNAEKCHFLESCSVFDHNSLAQPWSFRWRVSKLRLWYQVVFFETIYGAGWSLKSVFYNWIIGLSRLYSNKKFSRVRRFRIAYINFLGRVSNERTLVSFTSVQVAWVFAMKSDKFTLKSGKYVNTLDWNESSFSHLGSPRWSFSWDPPILGVVESLLIQRYFFNNQI